MRVLVIGANGFVGNHVVDAFRALGHEVITADITDRNEPGHHRFDAASPDFKDLATRTACDTWINCSGAANVPESFNAPLKDHELNTLRVLQMLDALRQVAPATRYVHLSSAAVYGNPSAWPTPESAPLKPLSPYGWHKLQAEQICREFSQLFGVPTISARIFSAYGPGLRKQLFWDVFNKARQQKKVELFGTGEETRDFIYVTDLAGAIETLVRKAEFDGRAVNVASGESTTVRSAVSLLFDALDWERTLEFNGHERKGDPIYWQADVSYLKSLGFTSSRPMADGLLQVGNWLLAETASDAA